MRVVNVRGFGGVRKAEAAGVIYCGRPSPLGNPFPVGPGRTREAAIAEYRVWLWEKVSAGDLAVVNALLALREGDSIGCWCSPQACHGDVVIRAARWLRARAA